MPFIRFKNRKDAGVLLAEKLIIFGETKPVILAIPRGGVVIGYEIAKALRTKLDIIIPRKLGAPGNPELAIGAVAEDGTITVDYNLMRMVGASESYLELEKKAQIDEIKRRKKIYRGGRADIVLHNKKVILVDDGVATGATMKVSIAFIKRKNPESIILAVPVGPPDTINELKDLVDEVICLEVIETFFAIGQFYEDFSQVSDETVIELLNLAKKFE